MIVQCVYAHIGTHVEDWGKFVGPSFFFYRRVWRMELWSSALVESNPLSHFGGPTLVISVVARNPLSHFVAPDLYYYSINFKIYIFFQKPLSVYLLKNQITGQENSTLETKSSHREQ